MAKRILQFQKGLSIVGFIQRYATEDDCRRELFHLRWPNGFACPRCSNKTYCQLRTRKVYQCNRCHSQTSVTAGTIFHASNLPLTKWFLAIYLLTQNKTEISAMALSRQIAVSYNAAWRLKHKLTQVIIKRDSDKKFTGHVAIEDPHFVDKRRHDNSNRSDEGKALYGTAIETGDKHSLPTKFSLLNDDQKPETERWGEHHLCSYCIIVSDGLICFNANESVRSLQRPTAHSRFKWIQSILNIGITEPMKRFISLVKNMNSSKRRNLRLETINASTCNV